MLISWKKEKYSVEYLLTKGTVTTLWCHGKSMTHPAILEVFSIELHSQLHLEDHAHFCPYSGRRWEMPVFEMWPWDEKHRGFWGRVEGKDSEHWLASGSPGLTGVACGINSISLISAPCVGFIFWKYNFFLLCISLHEQMLLYVFKPSF
jgi:hypothetical protein